MPYFVPVDYININWPNLCPFCERFQPTTMMSRSYARDSGYYFVFFTTISGKYAIPVCGQCSAFGQRMLVAGLALVGLPWVFVLAGIDWPPVLTPVFTLPGIALLLYRWWWLRSVRITYWRDSEAIYAVRSETFAKMFATANAAQATKRLFYFRFR